MIFRLFRFILKKLITTRSILINYNNEEYLIDNQTDPLIIKINDIKFLKKIFYAPSLVLAEGYMNENYELPNSNFYDFSEIILDNYNYCLLYTSPSPRDGLLSRMPSSA